MTDPTAPHPPYRVLARKYRPDRFADLIGQEALVRTLGNAIRTGRIAHAFMLTGVRGVGKTTTARIIARALNCIGPDGGGGPTIEPCGVCANCRAIAEDRHVDVLEMDAASRTGVGDMRELIDGVRYLPVQARYKIYIIDEVHMLSMAAFNALLKTLEEPPAHVKFVFATTEIRKVPITILSRCQRFDLRRIEADRLFEHFRRIAGDEGVTAEDEALRLIARAADGSVRDGLSLLDQAIALGDGPVEAARVRDMLGLADRGQVFALFGAVMKGAVGEALDRFDGSYRAGADPVALLQDLLGVVHMVTRLKTAPDSVEATSLPEIERVEGGALAGQLSVPVLTRAWQILLKGLGETQAAPVPRQAAEMVLIRLAHVASLPDPAQLVRLIEREREAGPAATPPSGPAGGVRAEAGGGRPVPVPQPVAVAPPAIAPSAELPQPATFAEAVALFADHREVVLHAQILQDVQLVRFEPGRIELRLRPEAKNRETPNRMGTLLTQWTGRRWIISISDGPAEPTLRAQAEAAERQVRHELSQHPLVRAVLEAFPGAAIEAVRTLDGAAPAPAVPAPAAPRFGGVAGVEAPPDPAEDDFVPADYPDDDVDPYDGEDP
ncbi:DNA polymerase III subunit gamma/tau [Stella sp.]|uniref:DNA polymerase III subunit gamma/tau n=1 Tax=Stella sp. TaxID=2912054 RepID=UPI0035AFCD12